MFRVVVQCRLSSSRLPGKALLPVAGIPMALLCAMRVANRGAKTVIASSDSSSDDALVRVIKAEGFKVIRGPLDDVLARFCLAIADLKDDDYVVRVTADNLFPDGNFIEEVVTKSMESHAKYARCTSPENKLPYGVGVEVMQAGALREAANKTTDTYDREHVTPWLRKNFGDKQITISSIKDNSHTKNASVDYYRDYAKLKFIFEKFKNPITVPWLDLVDELNKLPGEAVTLGGAQLGLPYGITNSGGQISEPTAHRLMDSALQYGVHYVDCARAYGNSERVVGDYISRNPGSFEVITKLSPQVENAETAENSIRESLSDLRKESLDSLLLHRWDHRNHEGVWKTLLSLREKGLIAKLGASVFTPTEAREALADPEIKLLQIPFNLLDFRWKAADIPSLAKARPDVKIFARSVLLQGLLVAEPEAWPKSILSVATPIVENLEHLAKQFGRKSRLDLCFAYVRAQSWIHSIVLGLGSEEQARESFAYFALKPLSQEECDELETMVVKAPETVLNPALWELK